MADDSPGRPAPTARIRRQSKAAERPQTLAAYGWNIAAVVLFFFGLGASRVLPQQRWVGGLLCFVVALVALYGHRTWLREQKISSFAVALTGVIVAGGAAVA